MLNMHVISHDMNISPKSIHYLFLVSPWLSDQLYSSYEWNKIVLFFINNSMSFLNIPQMGVFKIYLCKLVIIIL